MRNFKDYLKTKLYVYEFRGKVKVELTNIEYGSYTLVSVISAAKFIEFLANCDNDDEILKTVKQFKNDSTRTPRRNIQGGKKQQH
jgi:hypothetical protein